VRRIQSRPAAERQLRQAAKKMSAVPEAPAAPRLERRQVNRGLVKWFVIGWCLVAFHLCILDRREVWPDGPLAITMCAAPPIVTVVMLAWGKVGPFIFTLLLTASVVAAWVVACRRPSVGSRRVARSAIVVYWLLHSFFLGVSA
jgi:hypothetical protein